MQHVCIEWNVILCNYKFWHDLLCNRMMKCIDCAILCEMLSQWTHLTWHVCRGGSVEAIVVFMCFIDYSHIFHYCSSLFLYKIWICDFKKVFKIKKPSQKSGTVRAKGKPLWCPDDCKSSTEKSPHRFGARVNTGKKVFRKALYGSKARWNWEEMKTSQNPAEEIVSAEVRGEGKTQQSQLQMQFLAETPDVQVRHGDRAWRW